MKLDPEVLKLLVCPETKAALVQDGATLVSTDESTRRRYRIDGEIPIMLIEESEVLDEETWRKIMQRHGRLDS